MKMVFFCLCIFEIVLKYTKDKAYYFDHFQMYNSVTLSIFTSVGQTSPLSPFAQLSYWPHGARYPLNSDCWSPLSQPLGTSLLLFVSMDIIPF